MSQDGSTILNNVQALSWVYYISVIFIFGIKIIFFTHIIISVYITQCPFYGNQGQCVCNIMYNHSFCLVSLKNCTEEWRTEAQQESMRYESPNFCSFNVKQNYHHKHKFINFITVHSKHLIFCGNVIRNFMTLCQFSEWLSLHQHCLNLGLLYFGFYNLLAFHDFYSEGIHITAVFCTGSIRGKYMEWILLLLISKL